MPKYLKLLVLVILLNVIRYVVGFPFEAALVFRHSLGEMTKHPGVFRIHFSRLDLATSYFYNFMMWLTAEWVFMLLEPRLRGRTWWKSLRVYGLLLLFFLSVSAIYMNHYSHPKWFYVWNMLDAVIVFAIVALANGILYPWFFGGSTLQSA
jgi:hypothetical protein